MHNRNKISFIYFILEPSAHSVIKKYSIDYVSYTQRSNHVSRQNECPFELFLVRRT